MDADSIEEWRVLERDGRDGHAGDADLAEVMGGIEGSGHSAVLFMVRGSWWGCFVWSSSQTIWEAIDTGPSQFMHSTIQ
jgi:hypothetical protein